MQAATLYYEGHNNYPAWKDREEEQEQARKRGTLGERQSWRAGGQARKTWHLIQNAMRLVEEVAEMEQCTPIEAAALVDQRLQAQVRVEAEGAGPLRGALLVGAGW